LLLMLQPVIVGAVFWPARVGRTSAKSSFGGLHVGGSDALRPDERTQRITRFRVAAMDSPAVFSVFVTQGLRGRSWARRSRCLRP
jgi:hypothetical protein